MNRPREGRRRQRWTSLITTAAVAYGTYRALSWAWTQYNKDEGDNNNNSNTINQQQRRAVSPRWKIRRQRLTRCREEVWKAVEGFLPTLRRIIVDEHTNTRQETNAIKALRRASQEETNVEQQKELWKTIQIKLLTRLLATAYANTILFLVLTVQVNLLGGRLLEEQETTGMVLASDDSVARMESYQASHRFVLLHTYDYFFAHGLLALMASVERAVRQVDHERNWNAMERLEFSVSDLNDMIQEIRGIVEDSGSSSSRRRRSIFRFLMPPSAHMETGDVEDAVAAAILDETWDILESPVILDAQRDALEVTFDLMREESWEKLFLGENGVWTTKPVASVIPQLKHTCNEFFVQRGGRNLFCERMQALPTVLELSDVSFA